MSQAAATKAIFQHLELSDIAFYSCIWKGFILSDILFTSLLHKSSRHFIVCLDAFLQQVVRQEWVQNDGQERGYAWKCQSQSHKEMVSLGISFIRIASHGDFQIPNVK